MTEIESKVKEFGRKTGPIIRWIVAGFSALMGVILICTGSWSGVLGLLAGAAITPTIKKWLPIKNWQQILACFLLFFAAFGLSKSTEVDKVSTYNFDTGTYVGTVENNLPSGTGVLTYSELGTYEGAFENGKRNGIGKFTWNNGNVYDGEWKDDQVNGKGTLTYSNGTVLTANFSNGNVEEGDFSWDDGKGTYKLHIKNSNNIPQYSLDATYSNGIKYSGEFSNGNINGKGKMIYPDIGTYTGEFASGKKSGKGDFVWNDGDSFSGIWADDKMNGQGEYTYSNGATLSGKFESNMPSGTLTYIYGSKTYTTNWQNGKCTSIKKA